MSFGELDGLFTKKIGSRASVHHYHSLDYFFWQSIDEQDVFLHVRV